MLPSARFARQGMKAPEQLVWGLFVLSMQEADGRQ